MALCGYSDANPTWSNAYFWPPVMRILKSGAGLHFEVGSTADDLAGKFGQFPVVVSLEVIEHCPSAREFMRSFSSLLAPGGVGLISTHYHSYVKNQSLRPAGSSGTSIRCGRVFFTESKLRQLIEGSGFTRFEFHRVGRTPVLAKSLLAVVHRS